MRHEHDLYSGGGVLRSRSVIADICIRCTVLYRPGVGYMCQRAPC